MKNKKILVAVLSLTMLLLVATAYASTPTNAGYEALKNVMKNHNDEEFGNGTVTGTISIVDNDETVLLVEGVLSGDEEDKAFSGDLKILTENLEKDLSIYGLGKMIYIVDPDSNDVYVGEDDEENEHHDGRRFEEKHEMTSNDEALMDYFVGDLSNEIELVNLSDGSSEIKLELTKAEMPALLNLLVSAHSDEKHKIDRKGRDEFCEDLNIEDYPLLEEFHKSNFQMTELVEEVEIEYLKFTIKVDQNQEVEGMSFEISVSGIDENEENHMLTVNADMNVTNVGNSEIKTLDFTGKNIIEFK